VERQTFKNTQYIHKDFDDRLVVNVELISQDVTARTSTVEITAYLYNDNLNFGQDKTFQVKTYVDAVRERTDSFDYDGTRQRYAIIDHQQLDIWHMDSIAAVQAAIYVEVNLGQYRWLDEDGYYQSGQLDSGLSVEVPLVLPEITDRALVTYAPTFTDDENYTVQYSCLENVTYDKLEASIYVKHFAEDDYQFSEFVYRDLTALQNPSVPNKSYTFQFTDEEIKALHTEFKEARGFTVSVSFKTTINGSAEYDNCQVPGRIIDQYPTITDITIKQANSTIVELTGDESVMVAGEGMAEFQYTPTVYKQADMTKMVIINGIQSVKDMPQGIIDDPTSGDFHITVKDSRGLETTEVVTLPIVPYFRPTCVQKISNVHTTETGSVVRVQASGKIYYDTFGVVYNGVKFEYRYTNEDGTMGAWRDFTGGVFIGEDERSYTVDFTIAGLTYNKSYTFQCRFSDRLHTVQSEQYTTTIATIFDWGNEDFNFNVPINMFDETVLRHNPEAGNTVLSGNNGHIYLRPSGTDITSNETIFYPDGSVNFNGDLYLRGEPLISSNDFVMESGTTAMGSNGTWYWRKWSSGKAECWGTRNMGNTGVSTAWGSLYRSATFDQQFPSTLFSDVPDSIQINLFSAFAGCWVSRYSETNPSALTTDTFVVVSPVSGNIGGIKISIHAIGRWK
jgi:hypothetical protein